MDITLIDMLREIFMLAYLLHHSFMHINYIYFDEHL